MWVSVALAGLVIGLALGALGGGGSILTVPALVYLLGQSPAQATSGSLVIVGVSAALGMAAHARAGKVRLAHGFVFGLLGTAGSLAGSRLSAQVPSHVLLSTFAALLFLVAVLMLRRARTPQLSLDASVGSPSGASAWSWSVPAVARVVLAATAVGLLTGFFGVGGGFAVVPALVLALGFEMPVAVGTSLLVIAINSATAFAARVQAGVDLDWPMLAAVTALAVLGSVVGARRADRLDPRRLGRAFAVLLIVVGAYLALANVPQLVTGAGI